jgi:hypothetical protein
MTIVKQEDMKVLGMDLSLSVSIKDRFLEPFLFMLNACLTLSWPDLMTDHDKYKVHLGREP